MDRTFGAASGPWGRQPEVNYWATPPTPPTTTRLSWAEFAPARGQPNFGLTACPYSRGALGCRRVLAPRNYWPGLSRWTAPPRRREQRRGASTVEQLHPTRQTQPSRVLPTWNFGSAESQGCCDVQGTPLEQAASRGWVSRPGCEVVAVGEPGDVADDSQDPCGPGWPMRVGPSGASPWPGQSP